MKIVLSNNDMVVKINEQTVYNVNIQTVDGCNISCNGFPTIQACMQYAQTFKNIRGRI